MRAFLKSGLRTFVAGALFAVGILSIAGVYAATLALYTGASGSNPLNQPQMMGDLNGLVNGINANAAFAGNAAPSRVIGVLSTTTSKLGGPGAPAQAVLQIMNNAVYTTTTGSTTCNITNAAWCLGILDANGNLHWLAGT